MGKDFFKPEEKQEAFDRIAKLFYERNFGATPKSEVELVMYDIIRDKFMNEDGAIRINETAKALGLTRTRVDSLEERRTMKYGNSSDDWKEVFKKACEKAQVENDKISICIPNRSMVGDIKSVIEEKYYGVVDLSLNSHVLILPKSSFMLIVYELADSEDRDRLIEMVASSSESEIPEEKKDNWFYRWVKTASGQALKTVAQTALQICAEAAIKGMISLIAQ